MNVDKDMFNTEESAALLRFIYPNWPDRRNARPVPRDVTDWLLKYRLGRNNPVQTEQSLAS